MAYYTEAKVYFDGSHYVAIPQKDKNIFARKRKRYGSVEKAVLLDKDNKITDTDMEPSVMVLGNGRVLEEIEFNGIDMVPVMRKKQGIKRVSKKETFEKLYKEYYEYGKKKMRDAILNEMAPLFSDTEKLKEYVYNALRKKYKNLAIRRIRCFRKAGLQTWNYFVTITYDDKKQDEISFRKKLTNTLSHLSSRKGWKYIGVWERGEDTDRLHFHGLFSIPEESMVGEIREIKDYDVKEKKMQITHSNSFFEERFGRNDFKGIDFEQEVTEGINYILKYIEKSGERIVYSRRLPTFFISDILEQDILGEYGEYEGHKLVLFDTFLCIDMGEIIGKVSKEVIKKMRYAY